MTSGPDVAEWILSLSTFGAFLTTVFLLIARGIKNSIREAFNVHNELDSERFGNIERRLRHICTVIQKYHGGE